MRLRDREQLLKESCRLAVSVGGYRKATIYLLPVEQRRAQPIVCSFGSTEAPGTKWTMGGALPEGATPVTQALATGQPVILGDLRRAERPRHPDGGPRRAARGGPALVHRAAADHGQHGDRRRRAARRRARSVRRRGARAAQAGGGEHHVLAAVSAKQGKRRVPRVLRSAHRARESLVVRAASRARDRGSGAQESAPRAARARHHGPRNDQRRPRPPRGRPAVAARCRAAEERVPRHQSDVPLGRRPVRRDVRRCRSRRRDRAEGAGRVRVRRAVPDSRPRAARVGARGSRAGAGRRSRRRIDPAARADRARAREAGRRAVSAPPAEHEREGLGAVAA